MSVNPGDEIILVDENDCAIGYEGKLRAHQGEGLLHRAFSVFIFNDEGQMLLQRRAEGKYHFAGLWSNACCSHPARGQDVFQAAHDRLRHEFGFATELRPVCRFIYRASDARSGLCEHEFDHVFRGAWNGAPNPNPDEICAWRWTAINTLRREVEFTPHNFTPWFKIVLEKVLAVQK